MAKVGKVVKNYISGEKKLIEKCIILLKTNNFSKNSTFNKKSACGEIINRNLWVW